MQIYYSDTFPIPLPDGHRFPLAKYTLLRERLLREGVLRPDELRISPAASDEQLRQAHEAEYVQRVTEGLLTEKEIRRIGFPWSPELAERSRRSVGGTIAACRSALQDGIGANLAGGTHHAYADHGEGFCVFNDTAVAVREMQSKGLVRRTAILDLDVHQGNGTAAIFRDDPGVFTLSVHGAKNFPFHKETGSLDIPLADGSGDEVYLAAVEQGIRAALEGAPPDLVVYLAGADPFEGDRLGRMAVSKGGLLARDRLVQETCRAKGLPLAIVLSGGYARDVHDTVEIHYQTIRLAAETYREVHHDRI